MKIKLRNKKKPPKKKGEEELSERVLAIRKSHYYVPAPPALASELGPSAAMIWAVIYNHSKQEKRCCTLSQASIGEESGCSWSTVERHLAILIENGYIRLVRDNRSIGKPNWYNVTGKMHFTRQNNDCAGILSDLTKVSEERRRK